MLVVSVLIGTIFKFLKSFAINYESFIVLEMLDAGCGSATYPTALILAMEMATARQRILVSTLVLIVYPFGQVVTALIAALTHNFRWLLRITCIFGFAMISYLWLVSESLRWLLVTQKRESAIQTVEKAARINGVKLSSKTYELINKKCETTYQESTESMKLIFGDCSLMTRLIICTICWISNVFITYGVSIMSVSMPGDKYVNFMVVSMGAVLGTFLSYLFLTYISRRSSLCLSLIVTGLAIIASKYFESNMVLSLALFFLGKCFIHHSLTSMYVYTIELWPTSVRHSTMGICSMVGRIGSIIAPMTPLLVRCAFYMLNLFFEDKSVFLLIHFVCFFFSFLFSSI